MIQYDPHRWLDHFFDIRGSLVMEIAGRVGICVVWSVAVVMVHQWVHPVGVSLTLHSLAGFALGLLLVFRTNSSYDRFWEGRKLWGGIVNETRNLIRQASVYLAGDPELVRSLAQWTALFPRAVICTLRDGSNFGPHTSDLPPDARAALEKSQHPALFVSQQMTACLEQARQRDLAPEMILVALDSNIQQLVDYLGGCERIRRTPLPFAYVVHLRRALLLYLFTLPFALVESFGWFTILDTLFFAYTFLGIEEIGVEIEGPFGDDANDLPLPEISETIYHNVFALAGISKSGREAMPAG